MVTFRTMFEKARVYLCTKMEINTKGIFTKVIFMD